jgi:hypothetical protein
MQKGTDTVINHVRANFLNPKYKQGTLNTVTARFIVLEHETCKWQADDIISCKGMCRHNRKIASLSHTTTHFKFKITSTYHCNIIISK